MSKNVWLYFGKGNRNLMVPSSRLRGMYPEDDGTLELSFDSLVNTNNSPTDKAILNLFEDNTHRDVIKAIGRAMHNETPTFNGFITVADETTSAGFHVPEYLTEHDGTEAGTIVSVDSLVIQDITSNIIVPTADGGAWAGGFATPRSGYYLTIVTNASHVIHLPVYALGSIVEYTLLSGTTGYLLRTFADSGSNEKINGVGGSVSATIPPYAKRVRAIGVMGGWEVNFYNELGYIDSVGNGFDAPDLTNDNNEALDILATGAAVNITGAGVNIAGGSGEIDLTTTGTLDINANALDMDLTDSSNITLTSSEAAEDLTIELAGATDSSLILSSTGTGADALQLITTAGGIDITSTGAAAGEDIDISTNASVNITSTEDTANAIFLSATTGGVQIQSLDGGTGSSDVNVVSSGGAVNIQSAQSAGDAITLLATTGGIDITAADASAGEDIDITATGSSINLTSTEGISTAIVLNASNAAGGIEITAGSSVDISGGSVFIANRKDELDTLSTITDSSITVSYGTEYIVNDGNGGAIVLPNAAVGKRITIILGTILTGNLTITAAATNQLFKGYAIMEATDVANNKTLFQPDGTDDDVITLNGSTTGGLVGDKIELVGISNIEWRVRATMSHTGAAANPFS